MKRNLALKIAASLMGIAFALGAPQGAMAAGTLACTSISNQASVAFTVGGVPQTGLTSLAAAFKVGNKVNLAVATTEVTWVTVYPGSTASTLNFTINNLGNANQKYALTTLNSVDPFGGVDNFNAIAPAIWIETGVATNVFTAATTTVSLAPDTQLKAQIRSDISLAQLDLDISAHYLMATTLNADGTVITQADATVKTGVAGLTTCTNAEGAYVVFADIAPGSDDIAKDKIGSARDSYKVCAANLTITKSSVVYWDPINLFVTPKAIPGAIINYTITATNNGAAACANATNVTIADSLNTEIAVNGSLAFRTQFNNINDVGGVACAALNGMLIKQGTAAAACKTNVVDAEVAPVADFTTNVVNAGPMTIPIGVDKTTTVKFQAIIN